MTPKEQVGNPKPRLFRFVEEESLRNKMGFNNDGADKVYDNIFGRPRNGKLLGVNLGKNKITPILENQFYREVEPDNRVKVFCKAFGISAFGFGLIGLIIYYNKWAFK